MKKTKFHFIVLLLCSLMFSCASSLYDHYTFTETIGAKTDAQSLIRQSVTSYENHISQIESFKSRIDKMVIYEKEKSKNEITLKMWNHMNSENSSLSKFLVLWKEKDKLNPAFTEDFASQIDKMFDLMIAYETKKDQESKSALEQLLTVQ